MFEGWKLKRERRKTVRFYEKAFAECKADKTKTKDDLWSLGAEESHEVSLVDDALNELESDRLVEEARELDIETPRIKDDDPLWEKDWQRQRHFLSAKGRSMVRRLIDEEKARRFEVNMRLVVRLIIPLIVAIGALLGAATGFVLALKK